MTMDTLFTDEDLAVVAPVLVADHGDHWDCGGWWIEAGGTEIICACKKTLWVLEVVKS